MKLLIATTDGRVHAVDPTTEEKVCSYNMVALGQGEIEVPDAVTCPSCLQRLAERTFALFDAKPLDGLGRVMMDAQDGITAGLNTPGSRRRG